MLKRFACGVLLLASGLFSSGCCLTQHGVCDAGAGCDSCGVAECGTCGDCEPGLCHHPWLWGGARSALTCGAGCGEVYTGEWTSDPPSCGGPCDTCGDVSCGGCGGCWNPLRGLAHLWGYRYAPAGYGMGYDEGCEDCADSYDTILPGEVPTETPTPERVEEKLPPPKPDAEPEPAKQASVKRPSKTVKHLPASHRTTTVRRR